MAIKVTFASFASFSVSKVEKWESVDGSLFDTEKEAKKHDASIDMLALVESFYYHDMSSNEIAEAILLHKDKIATIFNDIQ